MDRRGSSGSGSDDHRDRVARIVELRRTLRFGSVLVGIVQLATGFAFAARYPERAAPFFTLWTSGAIASFVLFVAASRASQRFVVPLTIVLAAIPR